MTWYGGVVLSENASRRRDTDKEAEMFRDDNYQAGVSANNEPPLAVWLPDAWDRASHSLLMSGPRTMALT